MEIKVDLAERKREISRGIEVKSSERDWLAESR